MRSQRDLYENELRKEEVELREWPEEEQAELERIYRAKGLSEEESRSIASRLMVDPEVALDTLAREELGLDPSQLGSPVGAASSSFVAFVVGAAIPIVPYAVAVADIAFFTERGTQRSGAPHSRRNPGAPDRGQCGVGSGADAPGGRCRGCRHSRYRPSDRRIGRQPGVAEPQRSVPATARQTRSRRKAAGPEPTVRKHPQNGEFPCCGELDRPGTRPSPP